MHTYLRWTGRRVTLTSWTLALLDSASQEIVAADDEKCHLDCAEMFGGTGGREIGEGVGLRS